MQVRHPVILPPPLHADTADTIEVWYVSGPMRGYHHHNYAAFDAARDFLHEEGKFVISPADNNRARGITEDIVDVYTSPGLVHDVLHTDTLSIVQSHGVYFLKGWSQSVGARYEFVLADYLGKGKRFEAGAEVGGVDVMFVPAPVEAAA